MQVSCTFPCYNEAANVSLAVSSLSEALEREIGQTIEGYEIICVDDGSQDLTARRIHELQESFPRVRLLRHSLNQGYGAALLTGLRASRFEWLFFSDADNQFDYAEIGQFLKLAATHPILCGYRGLRRDPWIRRLNGWAWNVLLRALFGYLVRDVNCAFKLFHRRVLDEIGLDRLISTGALINAELLTKMKRSGHVPYEIEVSHRPRTQGLPSGGRPGVIGRAFAELWKLYRS